MPTPNNGAFRIPHLVLIAAMTVAILGLASWSLRLEEKKADRVDVERSVGRIEMKLDRLIELRFGEKR